MQTISHYASEQDVSGSKVVKRSFFAHVMNHL